MIKEISIDKINPHPDNPRKDVGDVSELAESIKANGIMQNLTVVPYFSPVHNRIMEGIYTVIIGHRRLAAAKLAELETVPCVVAEGLSDKDQISIMLLENMQRQDLTIIEQADGLQMMLDLGSTVDEVSQKTGLSKATIKKRTNLTGYDRDKVVKSLNNGATLEDYEKLNTIKDEKLRNEVLDCIGTNNFAWKLSQAKTAEKANKNRPKWKKWLDDNGVIAVDKFDYGKMSYDCAIYVEKTIDDAPALSPDVKHYYIKTSVETQNMVSIYKDYERKEPVLSPEQQKERENRDALKDIETQAFKSRRDFVSNYTAAKSHIDDILAFAVRVIVEGGDGYIPTKDFCEITKSEDVDGAIKDNLYKSILVAIYLSADNSESYTDWYLEYEENTILDAIYELLEKLGYQMSDEEKQLKDGTHELYKKETEK